MGEGQFRHFGAESENGFSCTPPVGVTSEECCCALIVVVVALGSGNWVDLISVAHDNDGNGSVRLAEGAGRTCRDAMVIFLFLGTVLSRPHLFFWGRPWVMYDVSAVHFVWFCYGKTA